LFAYGPADVTASRNPIISCLIFIQTGFTFLVPEAVLEEAVKWVQQEEYRSSSVAVAVAVKWI